MRNRTMTRAVLIVVGVLALLASGCDWRGPAPTEESVAAVTGPFAIASVTVPDGFGFGGGHIYYPTDTTQGLYGGVAVVSGFLSEESDIAWYGPRVASQGFVVITIETNSGWDFPGSRGDQLLAALDYLTNVSAVKDEVDANRLAVMGWSMGGGGALEAAKDRPSLKASIPLAPWNTTKDWPEITVPTMIVGCEDDGTAPVDDHAIPFYESLSAAPEKAYVEIAGAPHGCVTEPNTAIARQVISWLKRFVDGDTRYSQFVCPSPASPVISQTRDTCPV